MAVVGSTVDLVNCSLSGGQAVAQVGQILSDVILDITLDQFVIRKFPQVMLCNKPGALFFILCIGVIRSSTVVPAPQALHMEVAPTKF
jgi:hypothetical protein